METETTPARGPRAAAWLRPRLPIILLLLATAAIYLTAITRNGMGNQFYAASAWAGSHDWKALLFGSLDPGNSITVDKPPLSQWVMGLSGRIFGFSSASMLIPQALMAVLSVGLLYGAVRRLGGRAAGLIAGAALALTPVAALMFRFNNPDAAMVTLMVLAVYGTVRALRSDDRRHGTGWLALAGLALGLAFLAKMLEGLLVAPAIGLTYLIAAPTRMRRRLLDGLAAVAALVVGAGWYVLLTAVWPASSRPYLAGSTDNTFMNLVLGYNGFGRVTGQNHHGGPPTAMTECFTALADRARAASETGGAGTGHGGFGHGGFGGGQPGLSRLFTGEWGLEVSFLLPAAIVALVAILVLRGRAPRTDPMRAGAILFGGWLLVDGGLLATMKQAAHPYYSLSLVPAIAGLVGLGLIEAWRNRATWAGRGALAAQLVAAGGWAFVLLGREPAYAPGLRWAVLAGTVVLVAAALLPAGAARLPNAPESVAGRAAAVAGLLLAGLVVFGGSAAYAVSAIAHPQSGGNPTVSTAERGHGPGGPGGPGGGFRGTGDRGGDAALDALLRGTDTQWAAAVNGSSQAASLELATGKAVMAVGGFTGQDPSPTLAQMQSAVRDHEITYFILTRGRGGFGGGFGGGGVGGGGGAAPSNDRAGDLPAQCSELTRGGGNPVTGAVQSWVSANFPSRTVDGATVYDLTAAPELGGAVH